MLYRAHKKQATIRATITSSTPRIVTALAELADTDETSDNAYGNLANTTIWALSTRGDLRL